MPFSCFEFDGIPFCVTRKSEAWPVLSHWTTWIRTTQIRLVWYSLKTRSFGSWSLSVEYQSFPIFTVTRLYFSLMIRCPQDLTLFLYFRCCLLILHSIWSPLTYCSEVLSFCTGPSQLPTLFSSFLLPSCFFCSPFHQPCNTHYSGKPRYISEHGSLKHVYAVPKFSFPSSSLPRQLTQMKIVTF